MWAGSADGGKRWRKADWKGMEEWMIEEVMFRLKGGKGVSDESMCHIVLILAVYCLLSGNKNHEKNKNI